MTRWFILRKWIYVIYCALTILGGGIVTSIVIIDNYPMVANGIGAWLNATGRFVVYGIAENLTEASALMERLKNLPEIIILDISMGSEDGLDFIPMLEEICAMRDAPMPVILVFSMYEDPFLVQRALDAGARAYISKAAEPGEFLAAIDALLKDGVYVDPRYRIITPKHSWSLLSGRENEIVACIKQNMNNKQIAKRLNISIRTVENHVSHIYIKTGTSSREELLEL